MTAHRRAWTLRASLVAVLAAGGLFGIASPASAASGDPTITITNLDSGELQPGSQANLSFNVKGAAAPGSGPTTITITSSLAPDLTVKINGCTAGTCSFINDFGADTSSKDYTVTLIAAQNPTGVPAGGQKSGTIKIEADPTTGNKVSRSQGITLDGPTQTQGPSYVTQVMGFVKDVATGTPISGATVTLQDSAGHNFTTTTSSLGAYTFKSTQSNPIAPGTLAIGAQKNGYGDQTTSANAQAGQSLTAPELRLESTTASTAPSDAASVPVAAPPSDPNNNLSVAPLSNDNAASSGSGGGFSMILIVAGVLLVLLGIGAIVLILMRRRRDGDEGDDVEDAPAPRRGPSPVPASRGSYRGAPDPTATVRSGGYNDRTMVSRTGPSIADAPTTVQRPVPVDEYPDPYGAPPPRSPQPYGSGGGYGGDAGGYGGGSYGSTGGYGDPGYGDRRGGDYAGGSPAAPYSGIYGQPDEPPARSGYPDPGYGDAGGYGDRRGGDYGSGYRDSGAGYDPGYRSGGGYDQPTSGGGYRDGAGYGDSGGYGDRRGSEYEEPRGGYDRRNGGQPPESRGRLDWLDD